MFLFFNYRSHIFLSGYSIQFCMSNKRDEMATEEKKKRGEALDGAMAAGTAGTAKKRGEIMAQSQMHPMWKSH